PASVPMKPPHAWLLPGFGRLKLHMKCPTATNGPRRLADGAGRGDIAIEQKRTPGEHGPRSDLRTAHAAATSADQAPFSSAPSSEASIMASWARAACKALAVVGIPNSTRPRLGIEVQSIDSPDLCSSTHRILAPSAFTACALRSDVTLPWTSLMISRH